MRLNGCSGAVYDAFYRMTCAMMLLSLTAFGQQPDTTQTSVEQYIEQDESSLSLDSIVVRNVVYDPNTNTYTIEKLMDNGLRLLSL